MDFKRSCLYCKNLLVRQTNEKNGIDLSKFKHPEMFNDKKCEYLCILDKVPCEKRDWYCHTFNPDYNEVKDDKLQDAEKIRGTEVPNNSATNQ